MTDFYHRKIIKARKRQTCGCLIKEYNSEGRAHHIEPGSKYYRIAQVYQGEFYTDKLCPAHYAILQACFELAEFPEEGIDTKWMRVEARDHLTALGFFKFLSVCRKHLKRNRGILQ